LGIWVGRGRGRMVRHRSRKVKRKKTGGAGERAGNCFSTTRCTGNKMGGGGGGGGGSCNDSSDA